MCVCVFRGIRYLSQHCAQRYEMIGELLIREEHDLALLQEVGGVEGVSHCHGDAPSSWLSLESPPASSMHTQPACILTLTLQHRVCILTLPLLQH